MIKKLYWIGIIKEEYRQLITILYNTIKRNVLIGQI